MSDHRLAAYGARLLTIDGERVVEMRDPNDNAQSRYQYRRIDGVLQRRVLAHDGTPMLDTGSPWGNFTASEIAALYAVRGEFHPVLDSFGL